MKFPETEAELSEFWGKEALEEMLHCANDCEEKGKDVGDAAVTGWIAGYIYAVLTENVFETKTKKTVIELAWNGKVRDE